MLLVLADVLAPEVVARLRACLDQGQAADGSLVTEALLAHPLFLLGVEPRRLGAPCFSRYEQGMASHAEVAEAMPDGRGGIRADAGVTMFLNDRAEYDGGELVVDTGWGEEKLKEKAGACVVFPASARRGVAEVTRGVRWTAECWVQSLVADSSQREILYDIACSASLLDLLFGPGRRSEVDALQTCHRNLLRLWARP